ncbi:alpha/beta hydrolase [Algimonas porphyrae]|uniref:Lysophospholipase n=1 Tax=Algimonas porphyrae TaxID=1128113 RepID=A0ABQ5V2A3_9PROT|nr:alpha/beta hydrolase [Algimonas porphyrae]GLQ21069.1 lysophospholipase [Algimonas porphyrae]
MDDVHSFQLTAADGTRLSARHWAAQTPHAALALIHGFGEHSGRYGDMGQHLAANGIDVFAVDLRGHGKSDGKRGVIRSFDDFRADIAALLDHAHSQRKSGPLILFGHSMGGGIVLDHGLRPDPGVDGIIASAPLIAPSEPVKGVQRSLVTGMSKLFPSLTMKQPIAGSKISTLAEEQAAYEQDPLNHGQLGLRTAVEIIEAGEKLTEAAADWSLPLLMLHATGDQLTDYAASQAFGTAARADFRAFDKVEHELHNDTTRAQIYAAITDFVDLLSGRV